MTTDSSEASRLLLSLRRFAKREIECPVCGETFLGAGRARYCSPTCRLKAFRKRKKENSGGKSTNSTKNCPATP